MAPAGHPLVGKSQGRGPSESPGHFEKSVGTFVIFKTLLHEEWVQRSIVGQRSENLKATNNVGIYPQALLKKLD